MNIEWTLVDYLQKNSKFESTKQIYGQNSKISGKNNAINYLFGERSMPVESNDSNSPLLGFRFIKGHKFTEIFLEDEEKYLEWVSHIEKHFIQTNLHQKYKLLDHLGRGSFAECFKVESVATGKHYAVKSFNKTFMRSQKNGRASLINETKLMMGLRGVPHCIQLLEVHETPNSVYLLMELLEGGNPIDLNNRQGPMP